MPIEVKAGCTVITGREIELYAMLAKRAALKLEAKGFKRRGRSVLSILKAEGWTGTRERILTDYTKHIVALFPGAAHILEEDKRP